MAAGFCMQVSTRPTLGKLASHFTATRIVTLILPSMGNFSTSAIQRRAREIPKSKWQSSTSRPRSRSRSSRQPSLTTCKSHLLPVPETCWFTSGLFCRDYYFTSVRWLSSDTVSIMWVNRIQNTSLVSKCGPPSYQCYEVIMQLSNGNY